MNESTIKDLIHKLMDIDCLSENIATNYADISDKADIAETLPTLFKETLDIFNQSFYIQVHETFEDTKKIKFYAVGIEEQGKNILRYDNRDDNHPNLTHPPHHKHIGETERVKSFDGNIDTLIKELDEFYENMN